MGKKGNREKYKGGKEGGRIRKQKGQRRTERKGKRPEDRGREGAFVTAVLTGGRQGVTGPNSASTPSPQRLPASRTGATARETGKKGVREGWSQRRMEGRKERGWDLKRASGVGEEKQQTVKYQRNRKRKLICGWRECR